MQYQSAAATEVHPAPITTWHTAWKYGLPLSEERMNSSVQQPNKMKMLFNHLAIVNKMTKKELVSIVNQTNCSLVESKNSLRACRVSGRLK